MPVFAMWYWFQSDFMTFVSAVAGLATFFLAVIIAWRQFVIMRQQTEMMKEQTASAKRQEATTEKQGQIAETQHQIMQEQLAKRSDLRLHVDGQEMSAGVDVTIIRLKVVNRGNRGADGFHWEVFVGDDLFGAVGFQNQDASTLEGQFAPFATARFHKVEGHYTHKLFPKSELPVAWLAVRQTNARAQLFVIKWRIRAEDGITPGEELGTIWFRKYDHWSYATSTVGPLTDEMIAEAKKKEQEGHQ